MANSETNPLQGQRIALALEYDGAAFSGWQKQSSPVSSTVQGSIEAALSQIADSPISTTCAGRTDAGVHATCQVIHFDTPVDRGIKAWTVGVNSLLPDTVRVLWASRVANDFHARFSATARRYQYLIYQRDVASAVLAGHVTHVRQTLDVNAMHSAAQALPGERDFSVFRAAGCQSRSPFRQVNHARVERRGEFIVFDVRANAFLQHMVRNMAGALLDIGKGLRPPQWMSDLLASKDRTRSGVTAPPDGLYLVAVDYPTDSGLPDSSRLPPFLTAATQDSGIC